MKINLGTICLLKDLFLKLFINPLYVKELEYSSYHIIKFVGFMSIYYDINLDIVSSSIVCIDSYIGFIDLLKV